MPLESTSHLVKHRGAIRRTYPGWDHGGRAAGAAAGKPMACTRAAGRIKFEASDAITLLSTRFSACRTCWRVALEPTRRPRSSVLTVDLAILAGVDGDRPRFCQTFCSLVPARASQGHALSSPKMYVGHRFAATLIWPRELRSALRAARGPCRRLPCKCRPSCKILGLRVARGQVCQPLKNGNHRNGLLEHFSPFVTPGARGPSL